MILCIENTKDSSKRILNLIKEFSKVALYQINIQKSVAFLYTNNELSEREIKKTVPFTTVTMKKKRYLGINLTKEVKDLYSENYRILKKEIEKMNKWKHIPCSQTGRINIIKNSILPKAIYRFNAIPIEIPMVYLTNIAKLYMEPQKAPNCLRNLEKGKQSWRCHIT